MCSIAHFSLSVVHALFDRGVLFGENRVHVLCFVPCAGGGGGRIRLSWYRYNSVLGRMTLFFTYATMNPMELEHLTPAELDTHVALGTFRLAFVGMSNAGKSYRSAVLQNELDFFWYEVDAHIQKVLQHENMSDISSWLGHPTMETYHRRAQAYIAAEETCTYLEGLDTHGKNLVFDTTGSVIYLSDQTKNWLLNECLVVNIDVGTEAIDEMTARYFAEPKPVIWGDTFTRREGEDDASALKRCYPEMLRQRLQAYRALAHLTIPYAKFHDKTGKETLEVIKSYLYTVCHS